jgi:predicted nucleic acid-binding protein
VIVCLDTNILISGAARPDSTPGSLVLGFLDGAFTLVTSEYQVSPS